VLPLIIFIMPALFIVLAGSPVLRLLDSLHSMTHLIHHDDDSHSPPVQH